MQIACPQAVVRDRLHGVESTHRRRPARHRLQPAKDQAIDVEK
jgi:hypothetical protein